MKPLTTDGADVRAFLDYILPRLLDDQTFLVAEFSLGLVLAAALARPHLGRVRARVRVSMRTPRSGR